MKSECIIIFKAMGHLTDKPFAVVHNWRTGGNCDTRWFETYEKARAAANALARKLSGVVVERF